MARKVWTVPEATSLAIAKLGVEEWHRAATVAIAAQEYWPGVTVAAVTDHLNRLVTDGRALVKVGTFTGKVHYKLTLVG